jgi:sulfotransferase family protein
MERSRPLLVASAPRTGTTWVAWVLSTAPGLTWVNEPDNEWPNVFALKAKRTLGRFPVLQKGDAVPKEYEELWDRAFRGRIQSRLLEWLVWRVDRGDRTMQQLWRALCDHANPEISRPLRMLTSVARPPGSRPSGRQGDRVLVKTVYSPLALDWIDERFQPQVLIVLRHPLNVMSSWAELGWGGCALETNPRVRERLASRWDLPQLDADATPLQRIAWEVGLFTSQLHAGLDEHPHWTAVSHEDLCVDPRTKFQQLYQDLGLTWSGRTEKFLSERNRPGRAFQVFRVAELQKPDRWKERLLPHQLEEIWSVFSRIKAPWVNAVGRDLQESKR